MSKRFRLSPARLADPGPAEGLETKSMFPSYPDGVWRQPQRSPIAGVAGEAAASAALDELAEALGAARREGRLIQPLPLDAIDETYLVRDRVALDDDEMAALEASLGARGQQSAIEVADLGDGRYGLISGWRRLLALRRLAGRGQGPGHVLAVVRPPAEQPAVYRAMVEENEIRAGLSFYERARIVVQAAAKGVYRTEALALAELFAAAPAARRSKIGSFVVLVRALDGALRFPAAISEHAGLALARALKARPERAAGLRARLEAAPAASAATETRMLADWLAAPAAPPPAAGGATTGPEAPAETQTETKPAMVAETLRAPGLSWRRHADGSVTLSGPAMADDDFRTRLARWLRRSAAIEFT